MSELRKRGISRMEIEIKGMPKKVEVTEKSTQITIYHIKKPSQKLFKIIDGKHALTVKVSTIPLRVKKK